MQDEPTHTGLQNECDPYKSSDRSSRRDNSLIVRCICSPLRRHTHAHGTAEQHVLDVLHFITFGWETAMFSTSMEEIHSPPLLMTSLERSVICMCPKGSMVATSPVLNQLSMPTASSSCCTTRSHTRPSGVFKNGTVHIYTLPVLILDGQCISSMYSSGQQYRPPPELGESGSAQEAAGQHCIAKAVHAREPRQRWLCDDSPGNNA